MLGTKGGTRGRTLLFAFLLTLFFFSPPFLPAQGNTAGGARSEIDPIGLVGITVDELIRRFGAPRSVYAVRGLEEWQDDVVFVYEHGDFYILKDRVWQAGVRELRNIKAGDSRSAILTALGSPVESRGNSLFYPISDYPWPLMIRCEFNSSGALHVIFITRTDF